MEDGIDSLFLRITEHAWRMIAVVSRQVSRMLVGTFRGRSDTYVVGRHLCKVKLKVLLVSSLRLQYGDEGDRSCTSWVRKALPTMDERSREFGTTPSNYFREDRGHVT